MLQFQEDLLQSVRQMKAGKAARTTAVALTAAADARAKVGVSQSEFATLLGVSVRTFKIGSKADASRRVRPRHCCALQRAHQKPSGLPPDRPPLVRDGSLLSQG